MLSKCLGALRIIWAWTGDHAIATSVMVTAPAFSVPIAVNESADWFVASLTVASGLSWVGVLLPREVRETAVVLAGGLAAICGALVSIIFQPLTGNSRGQSPLSGPTYRPRWVSRNGV